MTINCNFTLMIYYNTCIDLVMASKFVAILLNIMKNLVLIWRFYVQYKYEKVYFIVKLEFLQNTCDVTSSKNSFNVTIPVNSFAQSVFVTPRN